MPRTITSAEIFGRLKALEIGSTVTVYVVQDANRKHVGTIRFSATPRGDVQCLAADWTLDRPQQHNGHAGNTVMSPWQYSLAVLPKPDPQTACAAGLRIAGVLLTEGPPDWASQLRAVGLKVLQAE